MSMPCASTSSIPCQTSMPPMMRSDVASLTFTNATLVLPDRLLDGFLHLADGRIVDLGPGRGPNGSVVDLGGSYLTPGFIDLHVHGGAGADFMDGTAEAFATVCHAHLRHGTTSLLPTSTVARHEQI